MGIQLVVKSDALNSIESALEKIASQCEIFPIKSGYFGLSIPTKVVDSIGEKQVKLSLAKLEHFDLWAGEWRKTKSKWKLW